MTQNWFSNFHCACTIIQDVHNEFIRAGLTDCSAFMSLSKKIQEKTAVALIIALIFAKKNKPYKMRKKKESVNPWLLRKILKFYETLLAEQRLEDKHNYKIILRMTSETFEETFQLIKIDTTKEKTKMRELILPIS